MIWINYFKRPIDQVGVFFLLVFLLGTSMGEGHTFVKADVTTMLGPTFFVDDASLGGGDLTIVEPDNGEFIRSFSGLLTTNQGLTTLSITGLGFASFVQAANNNASNLIVSITYLGADGAVGGGDDVYIGTRTNAYSFAANGEYAAHFDPPLVAELDITDVKFLITIAPTTPDGDGRVSFKLGNIPFDELTDSPKLSVAGYVEGMLPSSAPRVNLAKYQFSAGRTTNSQYRAAFATDGVVGNVNSWRSQDAWNQWVEVHFPLPVTIASAHVYSGINDRPDRVIPRFRIEVPDGEDWLTIPGSEVGTSQDPNTSPEVAVTFDAPVTSDVFRIFTPGQGARRLKELALFPPNPDPITGDELGFPIGTDVELNLAHRRAVFATSAIHPHFARNAVDGYAHPASRWQTTEIGNITLEIDLQHQTQLGSAHLYSGDGDAIPPLTSFVLQYWDDEEENWFEIPGSDITGNTEANRIITFTEEPEANRVRLLFNNQSISAVRQLSIFPANQGVGYPIGQDVLGIAPPTQTFNDFGDAFYHLHNQAADLPVQVVDGQPVLAIADSDSPANQYQIVLNIGTDTYRLRNRATGKVLAGAGLSTEPGLPLEDAEYAAMPHQQWRLIPVDGNTFYLQNVWSGLVIDTHYNGGDTDILLIQNSLLGTASQWWQLPYQAYYPKKGLASTNPSRFDEFGVSWVYTWGRQTDVEFERDTVYHPMQWGNFNWDISSTRGPLEQHRSEWQREGKAMYLMGFNEPDGSDQANMSVDTALALWPRLERMNLPLVSPGTVNPNNAWMNEFMIRALDLGYRIDAISAHRYAGPSSGNPDQLIQILETFHNAWERPVWLTEYSTRDWNLNQSWSMEDNYNWLAEFIWRAESLPWLEKQSLFLWTADENHPEPADVSASITPGPRSNAFEADGVTPTPFGELYFAWDQDTVIRPDKPYFIHNRAFRKRISDQADVNPEHATIRDGDASTQWILRPSGTPDQWHIISLRDGRMLRNDDGSVDFAPPHTTGTEVQWQLVEQEHGWFFIEDPSATNTVNFRLLDDDGETRYRLVGPGFVGDRVQWRFIVPFEPVDITPPTPPLNLLASAGDAEIELAWDAIAETNGFYSVYRRISGEAEYALIVSSLTSPSYTDTGLENGLIYKYAVTVTDRFGYESPLSEAAADQPINAVPPAIGITITDQVLTIGWPESHLGWFLQSTTNGLSQNNWITHTDTEVDTFYELLPEDIPIMFFRLKKP